MVGESPEVAVRVPMFQPSLAVMNAIDGGEKPIPCVDHPLLKTFSRATVFRWIQKGNLPTIRMGKSFLTVPSAVSQAIMENRLAIDCHKDGGKSPRNAAEINRGTKAQDEHNAAEKRIADRLKGKKARAS